MDFIYFKKLLTDSLILIIFFLQSCTYDYCSQIVDSIENKYPQELKGEMFLDLNEVFEFEWDVLYVCGPYGFDQEISANFRSFESQYDYVLEGETLFSFLKNNVLVEELLIDCKKVTFAFDNESTECIEIKSSKAKFEVKKITLGEPNYLLIKLN